MKWNTLPIISPIGISSPLYQLERKSLEIAGFVCTSTKARQLNAITIYKSTTGTVGEVEKGRLQTNGSLAALINQSIRTSEKRFHGRAGDSQFQSTDPEPTVSPRILASTSPFIRRKIARGQQRQTVVWHVAPG